MSLIDDARQQEQEEVWVMVGALEKIWFSVEKMLDAISSWSSSREDIKKELALLTSWDKWNFDICMSCLITAALVRWINVNLTEIWFTSLRIHETQRILSAPKNVELSLLFEYNISMTMLSDTSDVETILTVVARKELVSLKDSVSTILKWGYNWESVYTHYPLSWDMSSDLIDAFRFLDKSMWINHGVSDEQVKKLRICKTKSLANIETDNKNYFDWTDLDS